MLIQLNRTRIVDDRLVNPSPLIVDRRGYPMHVVADDFIIIGTAGRHGNASRVRSKPAKECIPYYREITNIRRNANPSRHPPDYVADYLRIRAGPQNNPRRSVAPLIDDVPQDITNSPNEIDNRSPIGADRRAV